MPAVMTLVRYQPKEGSDAEFVKLLEKHWPALEATGLVTKDAVRIWRARDVRTQRTFYVELFAWKDENASNLAHQMPEVMAVWEPMGKVLDEMQIAAVEEMTLPFGKA